MPLVRPRPRTLIALIALVLVAVSAAVLVVGSQPGVCVSCHAGYSPKDAAHAKTGCYDCHLKDGDWSLPAAKAQELFVMYPAALLGVRGPSAPPQEISRGACLSCHGDVFKEVVVYKGLRIDHSSCAVNADSCDACHALVPHAAGVRWKREPVMEDCIACHNAQKIVLKCDGCHVAKAEQARLAKGPWQVTHGANWQKTHGMGKLDSCLACHPKDYCVRCHGTTIPHPDDFGATHGTLAKKDRAQCLVCHKSERFCTACHGIAMPHPAGFLQSHDKKAKGEDDPSCQRCHLGTECIACHENHVHPGGTKKLPMYKVPKYEGPPAQIATPGAGGGQPLPFVGDEQ